MIRRTVLGVLVVVLFISLFSVLSAPQKTFKNKIIFDQTVKTINLTKDRNIDTIINLTAQILKIKNVTIICVPIDNEEDAATYFAYVQALPDYYLIRIHPDLSEDLLIESCSHEMVHCQQTEYGRLRDLGYGFWFEGKIYTYRTPYYERDFETEAYELEFYLKYAVKDLIYTMNPHCLN